MPELPEVECLARGLRDRIVGSQVHAVEFFRDSLRETLAKEDIVQSLVGRSIVEVTRRAKYLLIQTDVGDGVIAHLGMTGNLILSASPEQLTKHAHVIFHLKQAKKPLFLQFVDQRRFGRLSFFRKSYTNHPYLVGLGVEPLACQKLGQYLWRKSQNKRVAVKNFLMDAKIVVGVGNIYAAEALYFAGINPFLAAGEVSLDQYNKLAKMIKKTLKQSITAGGTSFRDYKDVEGNPGYFVLNLAVYGKRNSPCRNCKTTIVSSRLGGRGTFYCPVCQPMESVEHKIQ